MNTPTTPTAATVPQSDPVPAWAKDAAAEWLGAFRMAEDVRTLAAAIAKHAPKHAEKPSIWRPVSVKPTEKDSNKEGWVQVTNGREIWCRPWFAIELNDITHWCRTADLFALAPLPKEKRREELDAEAADEAVQKWLKECPQGRLHDIYRAGLERGRATAQQVASRGGKTT